MAGIGILTEDSSGSEYAYKILTPDGVTNNSILDFSRVGIIDDTQHTTDNVYSALKTQNLHDVQAQSIANLATASMQIVNAGITTVTTIDQQLPFVVDIVSTNSNIIEVDDLANTITLKANASYNFSSSVSFFSNTNSPVTITFDLVDINTSQVITSTSATLSLKNNVSETFSLITLLTIGKPGFPLAPTTIKVMVRASDVGYNINAFRSILASSSSYDFAVEASGISFVPNGGLLSTNVQEAIEEVQANVVLAGGSTSTFIDGFNRAKANADSIINSYIDGNLVSQSIVENLLEVYGVAYIYTSGILTSKIINKTSGGSVTINYIYDISGILVSTNQIGGD